MASPQSWKPRRDSSGNESNLESEYVESLLQNAYPAPAYRHSPKKQDGPNSGPPENETPIQDTISIPSLRDHLTPSQPVTPEHRVRGWPMWTFVPEKGKGVARPSPPKALKRTYSRQLFPIEMPGDAELAEHLRIEEQRAWLMSQKNRKACDISPTETKGRRYRDGDPGPSGISKPLLRTPPGSRKRLEPRPLPSEGGSQVPGHPKQVSSTEGKKESSSNSRGAPQKAPSVSVPSSRHGQDNPARDRSSSATVPSKSGKSVPPPGKDARSGDSSSRYPNGRPSQYEPDEVNSPKGKGRTLAPIPNLPPDHVPPVKIYIGQNPNEIDIIFGRDPDTTHKMRNKLVPRLLYRSPQPAKTSRSKNKPSPFRVNTFISDQVHGPQLLCTREYDSGLRRGVALQIVYDQENQPNYPGGKAGRNKGDQTKLLSLNPATRIAQMGKAVWKFEQDGKPASYPGYFGIDIDSDGATSESSASRESSRSQSRRHQPPEEPKMIRRVGRLPPIPESSKPPTVIIKPDDIKNLTNDELRKKLETDCPWFMQSICQS
ncbi:guanine nucleotide-binding protein subunit alpha, partial [Ascosphaera pollenicola]